jgi:hypothetical protein
MIPDTESAIKADTESGIWPDSESGMIADSFVRDRYVRKRAVATLDN